MGWCSGTRIFDSVVKALRETKTPWSSQENILWNLVYELEDMDWDCQCESYYWDDPQIKQFFRQLHPHWFEDEEDE